MRTAQVALKTFYGLLPVRTSAEDFKGTSEWVRQSFPSNFAAIALNGLCFPTAGRILGAGLLLTWFVSDLTTSAFWVGLIIPIQYGLALIAQPIIAEWLASRSRRASFYTAQALARSAVVRARSGGVAARAHVRAAPARRLHPRLHGSHGTRRHRRSLRPKLA